MNQRILMQSGGSVGSVLRGVVLVTLLLSVTAAMARDGQEIESLLLRGIPVESDPSELVKAHRDSRVLPFHPVDQTPLYGLPHGFIQTSVGRIALRVEDLSLPGKIPIQMGHTYDSGVSEPMPGGSLLQDSPRETNDLGPGWMLAYSDYIASVNGGLNLFSSDGSLIRWVPEFGSNEYRKEYEHPSDHVTLRVLDATTIEEDRADLTTWHYVLLPETNIYQLTTITDRHGSTLSLTYQGGYLKHLENSEGFWMEIVRPMFQLDPPAGIPQDRITSISDSAGRSVVFTPSSSGYLTGWTDANGKVWGVTYDSSTKLSTITNPMEQQAFAASYDQDLRISTLALGSGTTTVSYRTGMTDITDPRENTTHYLYGSDGITTMVQTADGANSLISVDENRNITTLSDGASAQYVFSWDNNHKLLSYSVNPASQFDPPTWTYDYDGDGKIRCASNPKGTRTFFWYNATSDVSAQQTTANAGACSPNYQFPAEPPTCDPADLSTRCWSASYDTSGNLLSLTNPRGFTTEYDYNTEGLRSAIILPAGTTSPHVTDVTYDDAGQLLTLARPLTATTKATWHVAYDGRGYVTLVTDPTQRETTYHYDDAGRLDQVANGIGTQHTYHYDEASRLVDDVDVTGIHQTTYAYDVADNLTTLTDVMDHEWAYTYDAMNRVATQEDPLGRTRSFFYTLAGGLQEQTFPSGQSVTYSYDEQNRLMGRSYPDGSHDVVSYDPNGFPTSVEKNIGWDSMERVQYAYNGFDEITDVAVTVNGEHPFVASIRYEYDANGNRTLAIADTKDTVTYTYDSLDRVTQVYTEDARGVTTMLYDPWSLQRRVLRMSRTGKDIVYGFDAAGRVSSYKLLELGSAGNGGGPVISNYLENHTFTRNAAGLITSHHVAIPGEADRTMSFLRDDAGRILQKHYGDGVRDDYQYDSLGRVTDLARTGEATPRMYEAAFNGAGEPLWVSDGDHLFNYSYDYSPTDPQHSLEVTRSGVFQGNGNKKIRFDYDGRVREVWERGGPASEFALAETFGWLPQGFGQVVHHWWAKDNSNKFYLPDLGVPWGAYADDNSKLLFPADYGVDALHGRGLGDATRTRSTESREEFRYFARQLPVNIKGTMIAGVPLAYGAPQANTFRSEDALTHVLGRSKESPEYYIGVGDLRDVPDAGFFDPILGGDLFVGAEPSIFNDFDFGSRNGGPRPLVETQRRQHPIVVCPGGCGSLYPHAGAPSIPTMELDPGDGGEGGTVPPSQCGNECRWHTPPPSCPLGFDSFFRNSDDQEPYRNAADDPYGVTLSNGEFIFGARDLSIPGIGPSLSFIRTYRSRVRMETSMGYGWFHNYQERLSTLDQSCTQLAWIRGDMMAVAFTWDGNGNYIAAPGTYLTLKLDGSAGFRLRFLDGTIHYFDLQGRLTRIEDRFGNSLRLEYLNDGNPSHSRDVYRVKEFDAAQTDTGRFLQFHYGEVCDSSGGGSNGPPEVDPSLFARVCKWRLKDVTDRAGRTVSYTYSGDADIESTIATRIEIQAGQIGNLRVVTAPATTADRSPLGDASSRRRTEYQYSFNSSIASNDPLQHNLREIRKPIAPDLPDADPLQGAPYVRVFYEADGTTDRVGSIAYGQQPTNPTAFFTGGTCTGGTCIKYQYEESNWPASSAVTKTTVTDRRGNKTEYEIAQGSYVTKRTVLFPTDNNNPILDKTACSCVPTGARSDGGWETCFGYDGLGQLVWEISPSGSRSDITYNDKGLLVEELATPATLLQDNGQGPERNCSATVAGGTIHRSFTYEPLYSQLDSSTSPRNNVTHYVYDYEEAQPPTTQSPMVSLRKYLADWDIAISTVAPYMNKQDQNGDGTGYWKGSLVKRKQPTVADADNHQHNYSTTYHPRATGQVEREEGPNGEDLRLTYFPSSSAGGIGGYVQERSSMVAPQTQPTEICGSAYLQVSTTYEYDPFGNVSDIIDPRQVRTEYLYNELNQLKLVTRAATAPSGLTAYSFKTKYRHDAAGNLVEKKVQSNSPSALEAYSTRRWTYDLLNRRKTDSIDVGARSLTSRICFDANENVVRTVSPEGRVVTANYDVRNLPTATTRYITPITNDSAACTTALTTTVGDGDATATSVLTYDAGRNVVGVSDPLGHRGTQSFDGLGRLVGTSIDLDANASHKIRTEIERDVEGNITAVSSRGSADGSSYPALLPLLQRTETDIDELGRLRKTWQLFERDGVLDACTSHTCSPGANQGAFESSYYYDGSGRLLSIRSPEGRTGHTEYDQLGRLWKSLDAVGNQVINCFDTNGNITKSVRTEVSGVAGLPNRTFTTARHYDALGLIDSTIVDPDGQALATTLTYDARGLLESTTDPGDHQVKRTYDSVGRVLTTTTPSSESQAYNPDGLITTYYGYDDDSNLTTLTGDLAGDTTTSYFVDGMNRPFAVRNPDGSGRINNLDAAGHIKEVMLQSSVGDVTSNPTICGASSIDCIKITSKFDNAGRLLNRYVDLTDANGHTNLNGHFEGTGEQHHIPETEEIHWHQTYRYDGLSRLLVGNDQNRKNDDDDDSEVVRAYDTLSRLVSEDQRLQSVNSPVHKSVVSAYDKDSLRKTVTYAADGGAQQRTYSIFRDALGRIQSMSDADGSIATYSYLGPAKILERNLGPAAVPAVSQKRYTSGQDYFDAYGRLTEVKYQLSGTSWIDHAYGYDSDSRRTYEVHLDESSGSNYRGNVWTYDGSDRLLTAENSTVNATGAPVGNLQTADLFREYVYDGIGNWREHQEKDPGSSITSSFAQLLEPSGAEGYGMNQYAYWKGSLATPTDGRQIKYDWLGNVVEAKLTIGGVVKTLKFYYDFAGRLVRVNFPDAPDVRYGYDVANRRVSKRSTGTPQLFVYDGWRAVEDYSGTDVTPVKRYVWGNGPDELLMMEDADNHKYYFAQDYLGSTVGVATETGVSLVKYDYGPFGELISECLNSEDESCAPTGSTNNFQFRYTGQRFDPETGLYYYKNRYYSPEIGRFLTRDPLGSAGGLNRYAYVQNSPVSHVDPRGLLQEFRAQGDFMSIVMGGHGPNQEGMPEESYHSMGCDIFNSVITDGELGPAGFREESGQDDSGSNGFCEGPECPRPEYHECVGDGCIPDEAPPSPPPPPPGRWAGGRSGWNLGTELRSAGGRSDNSVWGDLLTGRYRAGTIDSVLRDALHRADINNLKIAGFWIGGSASAAVGVTALAAIPAVSAASSTGVAFLEGGSAISTLGLTEAGALGVTGAEASVTLVEGFYHARGLPFKFSEYYYNRLFLTGRGAPFLMAKELLETYEESGPDPRGMAGFYRYANEFAEMIYNPSTTEVWHIQPQ